MIKRLFKDTQINNQIPMMLFFDKSYGTTISLVRSKPMVYMLYLWHTLGTTSASGLILPMQQLAMGIPGRSLVSRSSLSHSVFYLTLSLAAWGDLVYFY